MLENKKVKKKSRHKILLLLHQIPRSAYNCRIKILLDFFQQIDPQPTSREEHPTPAISNHQTQGCENRVFRPDENASLN